MKILVMSDTHGDTYKAEKIIRNNPGIDMVIHLGDTSRDAIVLSRTFPRLAFEFVQGNAEYPGGEVPVDKLLTVEGKKLFLTHGHNYSVKWDYERLHWKAREVQADLVLFGHTHVPEIIPESEYELMNPGSLGRPKEGRKGTYGIIEIKDGRLYTSLKNA